MKREIFNEEAISRLRSPEQLDSLLRITQPVAWMALLTLCFLVGSIILWSVFGVLSVKVDTVGMIIDQAGLVNVYHDSNGKIAEVLVRPGVRVRKGDVVAKLSLPSLLNDIIKTRQDITKATNHQQVESGIATFDSLMNVWQKSSNVVSAFDGIVTEVKVNPGDVVAAGATGICSIRQDQEREDFVAVMYVSAESGKKVAPGMVVQLAPSGADTQEDGSLLGVVREISLYPASNAGVMQVLGNSEIVGWIFQRLNGTVMEVRVDLVKDPKSPSGYLWTSVIGRRPPVTPGSICTGSIVVDRQPPLSRVFKKLSQWLRNS
ncbi:MAG: HlyD family efflux transporter periplasmic adaptor subunit [Synergistaceae bacterium]|jgi:multidrug efflux pump subunit AcrA (membrane-fusion protein)|nr:HlyD family efflux transporter periplasmic adaptor subunit [Synergistaceae bacterium]